MIQLSQETEGNFEHFRDAFSAALVDKISKPERKPKRTRKKLSRKTTPDGGNPSQIERGLDTEAEELADFIDYVASETFDNLPPELQILSHRTWSEDASLRERYALPLTGSSIPSLLPALDPAIADSLLAYGIIDNTTQGIDELLAPVLTSYISLATSPPPPPASTKKLAEECELCGRDWIPLTYHHLIPRFVHAKAVKRGWHREDELNNVAWLCGACHRFVHRFAGHEDLARHYHTVELLLEQEEVAAFAKWVGRLRWKGR